MFTYKSFDYWRCTSCAHVTTSPYPTSEQIVEHYRQGFVDRNYRTIREHAETYRAAMSQLLAILDREFVAQSRVLKGASLLDIGCFTGEFLEEAQARGVDGYGIELQEEAVAIARERLPNRVQCADVMANDLGFSHERFDVVTLLGVIEHVTDPLKLLRRARDLLAPGGVCFIQTPNSEAILASVMRHLWPPYAPVEHIHLFSKTSLRRLLEQEGFGSISIRRHVKWLTPAYVHGMLQSFGPELRPVASLVYRVLPNVVRRTSLPFYVGEMVAVASRI